MTEAISRGLLRFFKLQTAIVMTVILWILVIEVGARFLPIPGLRHDDLNPPLLGASRVTRTEGHPYLAYRLMPGWESFPKAEKQVSHNSLGFRGPEITWNKPKGVTRIACLGGSSTYGHQASSDARTWPARLEQHLREALPGREIEVLNGGAPGYSTFESLANLAFRVIDFSPDLIIVYHSINDMRCALYPNPAHDNTHWRAVWPVDKVSSIERFLEGSVTYQILRRYFTDYFETRADLFYYAIVDYDPDADPYVVENASPQGFLNARRNLISMVAVARAHGAEVLISTQGLWDADIQSRNSRAAQLQGMAQMEKVLRHVCESENVPLVEGAAALEKEAHRQAERFGGKQGVFVHEVHLSDEGEDLLARTFANFIVEHKLLEPK
ncbi:MAG: SGNH/GDSL hydrolase family protein [Planctomycetes bacterium]|nr:SGNH/GDSL hydrolase family protein [Planctomycetota bacterium]